MKRAWVLLNLVFGPLVLLSYIISAIVWDAETIGGLWGAVPESLRPLYTANMFVAAAGYFCFSAYILREINPRQVEVFGRFGFGVFLLAYAMVLIGSTIWMPLTCVAIDRAQPALVPLIFITLWTVAGGSLLLTAGVASARPGPRSLTRTLAIIGAVCFCVQTVLLDAIVWPLHFRI